MSLLWGGVMCRRNIAEAEQGTDVAAVTERLEPVEHRF
jgi:hypothetical protein